MFLFLFCALAALTPTEKVYKNLSIEKTTAPQPFSKVFIHLTQGVCDQEFGKSFLDSLKGKNGDLALYWENGQIKFKAHMKDGEPVGHFHGYYSSGLDAFKGHFSKEIKQGIHLAFFHNDSHPSNVNLNLARQHSYNLQGELSGPQYITDEKHHNLTFADFKNGIINGQVEIVENKKIVHRSKYKKGKAVTNQ